MIATARFQAMQKAATAAQAYSRKLAEVVAELAAASGSVDHPLLSAPSPKAGREALIVISSNRGLCGAYNASVLRTALAAHRAKVSTILVPKENEKDIPEIPKSVRQDLEIIPVEHMDDVLKHALLHEDSDAFYTRLKGGSAVTNEEIRSQEQRSTH